MPEINKRPIRVNSHLRILWLSWRDIKNPASGGAEKVALEVTKRFVQNGDEVTIFTSSFKNAPPREKINGVKIIRYGNQITCRLHSFFFYLKNKPFDLVIDEINTIPFFTVFYRKNKTLTLIHQLAKEYWFEHTIWPLSRIGHSIEPFILKLYKNRPTLVLSLSTKRDLQKLGFKNIQIYHLGLDFKPILTTKKNDLILFIGRLIPAKKPHDAVVAFGQIQKSYPLARLSIIGRGSPQFVKSLKKLIHKLNLEKSVKIEGYINEKKKLDLLKKAKIVLIPAVREGWNMVTTESNATGCIPIGYNVPGLKDSIKNNFNGILVDNPRELAQASIDILRNEKKRTKIALAGYHLSKKFSWGKCYQDFNQFAAQNQTPEIARKKEPDFLKWTLAISLIGGFLRLAFALILPLGGYDETYDIVVAQKPVSQMLAATLNFYPPIWHLVLNFLEKFTSDYVLLRLLPVFLGSLSICAIAYLAKKIFDTKIAVISAFVFALSPAQIYYSSSLRLYSFSIFLSILIFISLFNFLKNDSFKSKLTLIFAMTAGNYTYYLFPILYLCFLFYSILDKKVRQTRLISLFLVFSISTILTLPLIFYRQTLEPGSQNALPPVSILKILSIPITYIFPLNLAQLTDLYPYMQLNWINILLLSFSLLTIAALHMLATVRQKHPVLTITLILGPLITVIFSSFIASVFSLRSLIIFSVPLYLLLAQIIAKHKMFTFLYLGLAIATTISTFTFLLRLPTSSEDLFIEKNIKPADLLIHTEFTTYTYYSYLFPQIKQEAAIDSLYVNKTNQKLLNFSPANPKSLDSKDFWLLEIPSDIHREKVLQFKQEILKNHKEVSQTKFRDFELYKYEP